MMNIFFGSDPFDGVNARCEGNKCYTEDNILVFNLYVSNVPKGITERELKKHFSNFGEINSVSIIIKSKTRNGYRYGFVNFKTAESAAVALNCKMHTICGKKIRVRAADSWKQPTHKEPKATKNTSEDEENMENVPSILILNDDCLQQIFEYLSLSEQLKLSRLCERFYNVFDMTFKSHHKNLVMKNVGILTLMELRQMLKQVGHHIESISYNAQIFPTHHKRFIEFVPQYCFNLHHLEMTTLGQVQADTYKKISTNLEFLKSLDIHNCDINDNILFILSNLPQLETLDISENYGITGKNLNKFKNLKNLKLNNCVNLQPRHFIDVCKKNHLISLNIRRCDRLHEKAFAALAEHCKNLEHLIITNSYQDQKLIRIAQIKMLKILDIYCSFTMLGDELFEELAKHKANQLTSLSVFGSNTLTETKKKAISQLKKLQFLEYIEDSKFDDDLLRSLAELPDLKMVNVYGCTKITKSGLLYLLEKSESISKIDVSKCPQFNGYFILDAIDRLKRKRSYTPCTFVVDSLNVDKSILTDPKYKANELLLPLLFDTNKHSRFDDSDRFMSDEDDDFDYEDDEDENFLYHYDSDDSYGDDEEIFGDDFDVRQRFYYANGLFNALLHDIFYN